MEGLYKINHGGRGVNHCANSKTRLKDLFGIFEFFFGFSPCFHSLSKSLFHILMSFQHIIYSQWWIISVLEFFIFFTGI